MLRVPGARADRLDLLAVFPLTEPEWVGRWSALIVDPADRLAEVDDLFERGLISREQLEAHKDLIFGNKRRPTP